MSKRPTARLLWMRIERLESGNADIIDLALELVQASVVVRAQIAVMCFKVKRQYRRSLKDADRRTKEWRARHQ